MQPLVELQIVSSSLQAAIRKDKNANEIVEIKFQLGPSTVIYMQTHTIKAILKPVDPNDIRLSQRIFFAKIPVYTSTSFVVVVVVVASCSCGSELDANLLTMTLVVTFLNLSALKLILRAGMHRKRFILENYSAVTLI